MDDLNRLAQQGEEFRFSDDSGQEWIASWHPPKLPAPKGDPHGSVGICFTPEGNVILVTRPGVSWEFPGGRPEGDEDWRTTLEREVLEEACASVEEAMLLGFAKIVCVKGPEKGRVLVRSLWSAEVSLEPWEPQHETTSRMVVPPDDALKRTELRTQDFRPIYYRWFRDALAVRGQG